MTHFPAKAWCAHCQSGKRRQVGHHSIFPQDKEKGSSLVRMDYMFLKSTGESTTEIEEAWSTTLVVVHVGTGLACATAVEKKRAKGVEETLVAEQPAGFVVQVVLTFLKRFCSDTVILQTDGEPSIVEL